MARKLFDETVEEVKVMNATLDLPRVKQFVRFLGAATTEMTQSIQGVDEEINAWLAQGYKLFATHFVGMDTTANRYGVLYILIRE
jgi:hypothetical protein